MTAALYAYQKLEALMLALDSMDPEIAELVRDCMDQLWKRLDEGEHEGLSARGKLVDGKWR
jgi:hypothetical protein